MSQSLFPASFLYLEKRSEFIFGVKRFSFYTFHCLSVAICTVYDLIGKAKCLSDNVLNVLMIFFLSIGGKREMTLTW